MQKAPGAPSVQLSEFSGQKLTWMNRMDRLQITEGGHSSPSHREAGPHRAAGAPKNHSPLEGESARQGRQPAGEPVGGRLICVHLRNLRFLFLLAPPAPKSVPVKTPWEAWCSTWRIFLLALLRKISP